jgi:hypothetical protein
LGAFAALVASGDVSAQARSIANPILQVKTNFARDRDVSVRQRSRPDYQNSGVPLGAFTAFPGVTVSAEHNNNLYGTSDNQQQDQTVRIAPELRIDSGWSRHSASINARGLISRFKDATTEDTDDYSFGGTFRYDIGRRSNLSLTLDQSKNTEARTSPTTQSVSKTPIRYNVSRAGLSGVVEMNRLRLTTRLDGTVFNYENGVTAAKTTVVQDDRDRTVAQLSQRAEYAVSPDTALFVEVAANNRNYRLSPSKAALDRDSNGYEALVGVNLQLTNLIRGEIGAGYLSQSFKEKTFSDITGFSVRGQAEWFPTELITVTATVARTVEDSGIPASSGNLSTAYGLQADYELRRNIIVTIQGSISMDDYRGIDREDERTNLGASLTYLVNRRVGITAGFSAFRQNSTGVGVSDFNVNKVSVGTTLRF